MNNKQKAVAIQFNSSESLLKILHQMGITEYTISDEDDKMAEVEVTEEEYAKLLWMDEVTYISDL